MSRLFLRTALVEKVVVVVVVYKITQSMAHNGGLFLGIFCVFTLVWTFTIRK
jgi:hypothetical protein